MPKIPEKYQNLQKKVLKEKDMEKIMKKILHYWTSVSQILSVFNSIEISVLNIFNIQYYWPLVFSGIFGILGSHPSP